MTKEEAKQYIRNQINSSVKIPVKYDKNRFDLSYNKNYLRAKKLSKITDQPVNNDDFNGGEILFGINTYSKLICYYSKISNYLDGNYSNDYSVQKQLLKEVFNDYDGYKGYIIGW